MVEVRSSPASAGKVTTYSFLFSRAATRPVQSQAAWMSGVASDDTKTTRLTSHVTARRSRYVSIAERPVVNRSCQTSG
eukprot:11887005-Heterocapsa_arctica.AAC.1